MRARITAHWNSVRVEVHSSTSLAPDLQQIRLSDLEVDVGTLRFLVPALAAGCIFLTDGPSDGTDRTDDTGEGFTTPATLHELPDRGAGAGSIVDVDARRDAYDRDEPMESANPNRAAPAPGSHLRAEVLDDLREDVVRPRALSLSRIAGTGHQPWNGYLGRAAASDFVQSDYNSNWPFPEGRIECVPPEVWIDCCTYTLTEGDDASSDQTTYYKPMDLYASESDADKALREVYAQTPIFLPYTDGDVKLSHGWIYNGEDRNAHGSLDYGKGSNTEEGEDPAFRVRAAAGGTVVAKYWDDWHGNVLVIEHPGPADFSYRTFYFHLRDGKDHDLAKALSETTATGDEESSRDKYLAFANLDSPSDLHWGTNAQAIPVDVGDTVRAHQTVAWSGNTGPGGAGAGLNIDGTPTNDITANNHLHFMLAVSHDTWTGGEWLYVDPYGVYEQQSSGCYDLADNTRYDRLFAPFYPYFHGVDLGVFNTYLYYYGQMGRSPATFTVQQTGSEVIAAGAFKPGLSSGWYVYDYLEGDDFQDRWDTLISADFRITERSVTLDTQGTPRHNGVFRPDGIDDWYSFRAQTLGDYQDSFDELTGDGYDLVDFFGYHDGNDDLIASIFVPTAGDFIHHGLLSSAEFTTLTNDYASDGWLPVDVNVMEMAGGTTLSAIYRQTGDARMVHWAMSAAEYQQWMNFYLSEGWDLEVVQNYAEGDRYAAIWSN